VEGGDKEKQGMETREAARDKEKREMKTREVRGGQGLKKPG